MASRKEERDRLRAEREQRLAEQSRQERKRLIFGYAVAGVITLAVVAGLVAVIAGGGGDDGNGGGGSLSDEQVQAASIDLNSGLVHGIAPDTREGAEIGSGQLVELAAEAEAMDCDLEEGLKEEGNTHVPVEDAPDYDTEPATSGDHFVEPQADGAYSEEVPPHYYVHSLEHGRIVVAYSPELPEDQQLELKGFFDQDPEGMLLFPVPDLPYDVAAGAWTNLIGCESYEGEATLDLLRAFRDKWRGRGPEAIPL